MNSIPTRSPMIDWSAEALDYAETFEKMRYASDGRMPVAAHRGAAAGSRKTAGSRRASRRVAKQAGGFHQRRRRVLMF
jgi:hypothetical protein